jgi:hypothetical protein
MRELVPRRRDQASNKNPMRKQAAGRQERPAKPAVIKLSARTTSVAWAADNAAGGLDGT